MASGSNEPCPRRGDSTPPWHEGAPTPSRGPEHVQTSTHSGVRMPGSRTPTVTPSSLQQEGERQPCILSSTGRLLELRAPAPATAATRQRRQPHQPPAAPGHPQGTTRSPRRDLGLHPPAPPASVKRSEMKPQQCCGPAGLTSWSWFRSPRRMERLARDSTAVIPYRLMSTSATRFKTSCSSTMVWEHRAWGDVAPGTPAPQSSPGPTLCLSLHPGERGLPLAPSKHGRRHVPEAG